MKVYYLDAEYEPGKHKIVAVWSRSFSIALPEDLPQTTVNVAYSVLDIEEDFNRATCTLLASNFREDPRNPQPDRFYVDNLGQLRETDTDTIVILNPDTNKENYKLSAIYGLTPAQLETYIDTNVIDLASAKAYIKKLSAVVLFLVKHTNLE